MVPPSMVEKRNGAVRLIKHEVGHPIIKLHHKIHHITHHKNLCAKISNSDHNSVTDTEVKMINFIIKRYSLTHW